MGKFDELRRCLSSEKDIRMCVIDCDNFSNQSWYTMLLSHVSASQKTFHESQKLRRHPVTFWDVVEKFSRLRIVRSFKSWENGFFQLVELLLFRWMFQDILLFPLAISLRRGLYNMCKHNLLRSNPSIGENGFELVESYSWSVCVEKWNTKSYGVLNLWSFFGFHSVEYVEFEEKNNRLSSKTCTGRFLFNLVLNCCCSVIVERSQLFVGANVTERTRLNNSATKIKKFYFSSELKSRSPWCQVAIVVSNSDSSGG